MDFCNRLSLAQFRIVHQLPEKGDEIMRLIAADAARVKLQAARDKAPDGSAEKAAMDTFLYFLDACPTIEAVPVRHGRWEKGGYACGETEWKCSVCGETEWRTSCSRMKFCMFCGAKMDQEACT